MEKNIWEGSEIVKTLMLKVLEMNKMRDVQLFYPGKTHRNHIVTYKDSITDTMGTLLCFFRQRL